MSEAIKAIKVVHQLLVIASATIMAFAITPNPAPQYDKADRELQVLEDADQTSWNDFVYRLQLDNENRENVYLLDLVRSMDKNFPSDFPFSIFVYTDMHYPLNGTLREAREYLESKQNLRLVTLTREKSTVMKQWKDFLTAEAAKISGTSATTTQSPEASEPRRIITFNLVPPGGNYSLMGGVRAVAFDPNMVDRTAILRIQAGRTPSSANEASVDLYNRFSFVPRQPALYAAQWLNEKDKNHLLFLPSTGGSTWFPALVPFWPDISNLSAKAAREKLAAMRETSKGKISLFGISVDAKATVNILPWISIAILAYLISHLRQLRKKGLAESEVGAWVGLFDDWTGKAITSGTILVFPILANALLILRYSGQNQGFKFFSHNGLSLSAVILFSTWCSAEWAILCLRSK